MKKFFKIVIAVTIVTLIIAIGIWGIDTEKSDTETGWKLWGVMLGNLAVFFPAAWFWTRHVANVIDLNLKEDHE